jgi:hypothetical protein
VRDKHVGAQMRHFPDNLQVLPLNMAFYDVSLICLGTLKRNYCHKMVQLMRVLGNDYAHLNVGSIYQ